MEKGFVIEYAENKNESPTNKLWLTHGKTTAAQLCAVEKQRDYYKAKALKYHANAVNATLALNQTFEQISKEQHVSINSKVKQAAGLEHHIVKRNGASPNGTINSFLPDKLQSR